MSQTCPSCAGPASGRFCPHCGVAIEAECRECGSSLPPGARFCNQCAAPVAPPSAPPAGAAGTRPVLPWAVAGVLAAALLAVVLVPGIRRGEPDPAPGFTASGTAGGGPVADAAPAAPAPAGNPGAVDLSSMTPREAADRLFNRVMESASAGDSAQARAFVPMAVAAYQRVEELDTDGHYHLAALHLVGGDPQAARAEANAILAREPQHLFGLFTAAQAEQAMGNRERARELYQRFLGQYDAEIARGLPEYAEHRQALPVMRGEAERVVGAAG